MLISIDPGVSGGAYCVMEDGKISQVGKITGIIPEIEFLSLLRETHGKASIVVEKVPLSMGRNTGVASVKLNAQLHYIMGYINGMGLVYTQVTPTEWQMDFDLPKEYSTRKKTLVDISREKYPNDKFYNYAADAILIADWYYNEFIK